MPELVLIEANGDERFITLDQPTSIRNKETGETLMTFDPDTLSVQLGAGVSLLDGDGEPVGSGEGGGTPGGSDTQIQYNNAGAFGGLSTVGGDGTGMLFSGPANTITMRGGDDGIGDTAILIDNPGDGYLVIWSKQYSDVFFTDGAQLFGGTPTQYVKSGSLVVSSPSSGNGGSVEVKGGESTDASPGASILLNGGSDGGTGRTIVVTGSLTGLVMGSGAAIKTTTTTAHTLKLQGYDVNGTAYKDFLTITNGDTPDCTISAPAGTTMTLQPTTYKAADGTSGLASFSGAVTNITVKNGLVTAAS